MLLYAGARYKRVSDGLTVRLLKATESKKVKNKTVVLRSIEGKRDMYLMSLEKFKNLFEFDKM